MANVLGETLPSPPEGISQLHFSLQSSSLLLASGWDQVRPPALNLSAGITE
jgi:hypothetical protein